MNKSQITFWLLVLCTIVLIASRISSAQTESQQAWLEGVQPSDRERLAVRVHQYFEYEREAAYERLYELFSEDALRASRLRTKDDYVKARRDASLRVLSFKPLAAGFEAAKGVYVIGGEAEFDEDGTITKEMVNIDAKRQNGNWYLSELYTTLHKPMGTETLTTTTRPINNQPVPKELQKIRKPL